MAFRNVLVLLAAVVYMCGFVSGDSTNDTAPHVCIIGSGIGGSTAAYYLKMLPEEYKLTVFEKEDRVGGRVEVLRYKNKTIEAGASIIHVDNALMTFFQNLLELKAYMPFQGNLAVTFNGTGPVFQSSTWTILNKLQMFYRYGMDPIRFVRSMRRFIERFGTIYIELHKGATPFEKPEHILRKMQLHKFLNVSARDALLTSIETSSPFNEEIVEPTLRVNYGQNLNMGGLAGLVGMAGAGARLFAVEGGNYQIPEGLLKLSEAELRLKTTVTEIRKSGQQYRLLTTEGDVQCDAVVLATPFELSNITLPLEISGKIPSSTFHTTIATFVKGDLNLDYFGIDYAPHHILTTSNPGLEFNSIGCADEEEKIYKVFSQEPLSEDFLNKAFRQPEVLKVYNWKAYPDFPVNPKLAPFVLDDRIFYVNALEYAFSAMEVVAVSGKNVALLVKNRLPGLLRKETEELAEDPSVHEEL